MRIAIIGAGPAGLAAAYALSKAKVNVDVYEASGSVGGLAKSIILWGQTVDIGPHRFFSRDRRVNETWLEVAGNDYTIVNRHTHILYDGKFYRYPLQPIQALRNLGPLEAIRCVASYLQQFIHPHPQGDTFEGWVCRRFGHRLFSIFFKAYSEKLWGIRCDELDADFAAQRIKKFSLAAALKSALLPQAGHAHRTLADQFAYPNQGTGMIYERMAHAVSQNGGRILLNTPIEAVETEGNRVTGLKTTDGKSEPYDHIISTMPLTLLVDRLKDTLASVREASRQLAFRNTIIVYLEIARGDIGKDNWIYIHAPELQAGRITNFRNWSPHLHGDSPNTILAIEYWCNEGDATWVSADEALIALARREIVATGLVRDPALIKNGSVYRIPRCYPVYRKGYKQLLAPIRAYLQTIHGLQVIGRYGSFKYNNQDHSILMGLLAAENVTKNAGHDLWEINSDYDRYQEGTRITETGLIKDNSSAGETH